MAIETKQLLNLSQIYRDRIAKESVLQEKKAAKDYDGDGKVESGKDEYFGSKDKAIKKAMGKKVDEAVYGGVKKEKKDTRMVVTAADKKANTKAYQNYKSGNKAYKAADHLKDDKDWGYDKKGNSLSPVDKMKKERKKDELFGAPKTPKTKKESFSNWRRDLQEVPDYEQIPISAKDRN